MNKSMNISLRAGERIYLNGAVVRVDRKVSLELLNDVVFLLESHVLQPEQTTTPLRQLYFVLQAILMDPKNGEAALQLFRDVHASTMTSFSSDLVVSGLRTVGELVDAERVFDAMRAVRSLFAVEETILAGQRREPSRAA